MSKTATHIQHVGNDDFEREVVASPLPVIVDFYAAWCPPCQMLSPVLESVAARYQGRVRIVKCDTERDAEISESYGVGKIPNVMFFKNGEVVDQFVGYMADAQLSAKIEDMLRS
jgi:thioredoxin 1